MWRSGKEGEDIEDGYTKEHKAAHRRAQNGFKELILL
jgi:hypothetical protein